MLTAVQRAQIRAWYADPVRVLPRKIVADVEAMLVALDEADERMRCAYQCVHGATLLPCIECDQDVFIVEQDRGRALAAARMLREELEVSGHGADAVAATAWLDDAKPEGG